MTVIIIRLKSLQSRTWHFPRAFRFGVKKNVSAASKRGYMKWNGRPFAKKVLSTDSRIFCAKRSFIAAYSSSFMMVLSIARRVVV